MNFKNRISLLIGFLCVFGNTQTTDLYSSHNIKDELKTNANAVVRLESTVIEIKDVKSLKESYKRIVTVLNNSGNRNVGAYVSYDPSISVKKIGAIIYDANGNEIKKFKKSDFKDESAVSSFSLYEDSRVKYLEYTPVSYPYTVEFFYETYTNNTAYIATWSPLEGYYVSTENSSLEIIYDVALGLKFKEQNLEKYNVQVKKESGYYMSKAQNVFAVKYESYSPSLKKTSPFIQVASNLFFYEGYYGKSDNWIELGKWMYKELLQGRADISENTKGEILNLVSGVADPIDKAKIVYKYVQDRTRYISVQEGIGGIQPIKASIVDNVKYGDCKGLTNYTKALMDVVGVESYYTRVYASNENLTDVDKNFVSFVGQTNHVILNIPDGDENIWLECTSQKVPFGHIANFTDDRDVLVIKPEGGEIVHTKVYTSKENYLNAKATIVLNAEGGFEGTYNAKSGGTRYDYRLKNIIGEEEKERKIFYKNYWDYINELQIDKIQLKNNRDEIIIEENIEVFTPSYLVEAGDKMLFAPNVFKRSTNIPSKYSKRKLSFVIDRGYINEDEFVIQLPDNLSCESLPEPKEITTKFGVYKVVLEKVSDSQIVYKRTLEIFKGEYPKEDYKTYRSFRRKIAKSDKSSIVLNKK